MRHGGQQALLQTPVQPRESPPYPAVEPGDQNVREPVPAHPTNNKSPGGTGLTLRSQGYDFAFLRRSRPYEECSEQTGFKWQSQYVGGNALAVCQGEELLASTRGLNHGNDRNPVSGTRMDPQGSTGGL